MRIFNEDKTIELTEECVYSHDGYMNTDFIDNEMVYIFHEIIYTPEEKREMKINELRGKREIECFPIINRGKLWYDILTNDQLVELNIWYREWLNVTDTLKEPKKPEWLI